MGWNEKRIKCIRVGDAVPFTGLQSIFIASRKKKIPIGMVALGDWLGCYRMDRRVDIYLMWGQGTGWFRYGGSWQQL